MMFWQGQPFFSWGRIFLRGEELNKKIKFIPDFHLFSKPKFKMEKAWKIVDIWVHLGGKMNKNILGDFFFYFLPTPFQNIFLIVTHKQVQIFRVYKTAYFQLLFQTAYLSIRHYFKKPRIFIKQESHF